jgi:hypothetical protein
MIVIYYNIKDDAIVNGLIRYLYLKPEKTKVNFSNFV